MIFYGEYEILVDDSNQFAERARAAGVDLELRSLPEGQRATSSWGLAGLPRSTGGRGDGRVAALQDRPRGSFGLNSNGSTGNSGQQFRCSKGSCTPAFCIGPHK